MKHIRDHHNIDIGKGRSRDKQELLNMGYFHAYKAYKFVKTIDDPLDIKKFEEIRDIYELDNNSQFVKLSQKNKKPFVIDF